MRVAIPFFLAFACLTSSNSSFGASKSEKQTSAVAELELTIAILECDFDGMLVKEGSKDHKSVEERIDFTLQTDFLGAACRGLGKIEGSLRQLRRLHSILMEANSPFSSEGYREGLK